MSSEIKKMTDDEILAKLDNLLGYMDGLLEEDQELLRQVKERFDRLIDKVANAADEE